MICENVEIGDISSVKLHQFSLSSWVVAFESCVSGIVFCPFALVFVIVFFFVFVFADLISINITWLHEAILLLLEQ